ncbi:putative ABC-type ATPase [Luteibacter rhizovicinus]|uniref:Putative ABC-type ATPase n=1 Tax=Luteibacter rhizovicinus TaxID=242606 RepID=A0A4R3YYF1_9GAMM|nr:AAA family ATPase [Luteibacter rhizovicinus]TCV97636.1 putative ABC-type ATPase [Luteibacter rhizovicinus]
MPRITVLAGTNGAGKSSIAGAMLREEGGEYFNPDEQTRAILEAHPGMEQGEANALAWQESVRRLEDAIATRKDYVFETTLGGSTVTGLLLEAADAGFEVNLWYCGLDSPERHLERIRSRVGAGGHDIPEEKVRQRYNASRQNLARLIPRLHTLLAYDNSVDADPKTGHVPAPWLVLALHEGAVSFPRTADDIARTPAWAQPLVARAYQRVAQRKE